MTAHQSTAPVEVGAAGPGIDDTDVHGARPHRLTVEDVMTREVISVSAAATFHEMTELMSRHGISALPVVADGGRLLGVVSEADLLLKQDPPSARHRWTPESERTATRRRKSEAVVALGVMSTPALTVGPRASLVSAIRLLQRHQVKRLIVVDEDDQIIGIASRRDLLAGFARTDDEICSDIVHGVIPRWVLVDPADISVEVDGGVVRLAGTVDRRTDADVLAHLVRGLDGVVDVHSTVGFRWDDRDPGLARELHVN
jgi:CBS domain-containing protein